MHLSRSGTLIVALAAVSVALLAPEAVHLATQLGSADLAAALIALGSLVQLSLAVWVLAIVLAHAVAGQSALLRAVTPVMVRRALFVGAAGALTVGTAHAETGVGTEHVVQHDVSGLRLPDRPVSTLRVTSTAHPPRRTHSPTPERHTVVVRPGDTLWTIAARSLPDGADDAVVAEATRRWHSSNVDVVGDDPDLILPGQHLAPPPTKDLS